MAIMLEAWGLWQRLGDYAKRMGIMPKAWGPCLGMGTMPEAWSISLWYGLHASRTTPLLLFTYFACLAFFAFFATL